MTTALLVVFTLAYLAIAFEHSLRVDKSASALIGAGVLWTIHAVASGDHHGLNHELSESLAGIAQIVFFLLGAMTIVEVIDAHDGFTVITARIRTRSLVTLMWLVGVISFFLSAVLDNLTTTIVMVSMMRRLLGRRDDRLLFAGIIVIAANAGGAWSPIGDVTTTMLWIGGQVTALRVMQIVFLPSVVNLLVPLLVLSRALRGREVEGPALAPDEAGAGPHDTPPGRGLMLFLGLGLLLAVPAFKTATGLPPFMGILFGLGILWLAGDLLHRDRDDAMKERLTLVSALSRIDLASITFFIGILLAVATLEHTHILAAAAESLDRAIGRLDIIVLLIGFVSAIVDNVPLVAASMGMYSLERYPTDSLLWEFLAYCSGTGGSILVIGSAAGVAAMGLENIAFGWYLRRISGLALLGYLAGALVFLAQRTLSP